MAVRCRHTVLNDGSDAAGRQGDKPTPTTFRIGWENSARRSCATPDVWTRLPFGRAR